MPPCLSMYVSRRSFLRVITTSHNIELRRINIDNDSGNFLQSLNILLFLSNQMYPMFKVTLIVVSSLSLDFFFFFQILPHYCKFSYLSVCSPLAFAYRSQIHFTHEHWTNKCCALSSSLLQSVQMFGLTYPRFCRLSQGSMAFLISNHKTSQFLLVF